MKLKRKAFALIGVHVGGSTAPDLKAIMERENLPWRSFVDLGAPGAGPIAKAWNFATTPTLYVIDNRGVIRFKWSGPPGEKVLDSALGSLIKEAENPLSKRGNDRVFD